MRLLIKTKQPSNQTNEFLIAIGLEAICHHIICHQSIPFNKLQKPCIGKDKNVVNDNH
jgi:hypothetical protein